MRSSCNFTLNLCKTGPVWIVSLLLFFMAGCNSQMAELTSMRRTPITLTTSNIGSFTKVLIYAKRAGGTEAFAKFYDSTPPIIDRELLNGEWTFYGLAYNFSSISTCAIATAEVVKVRQYINLDFSNATCANEVFLGTDPTLTPPGPVVFATTKLEFCESVKRITSSDDECTDDLDVVKRKQARGHAASFQYSLMGFEKSNGVVSYNGDEFAFNCASGLPSGGSYRGLSVQPMGFNLPAGDGVETPFSIRLKVYTRSTACSIGTPNTIDLPNGLVSDTAKVKYVIEPGSPSNHKLYIKNVGEEICQGENLTSEWAGGFGTIESPRLICNTNQLYSIFPSNPASYGAYAGSRYKLLSDLDVTTVTVGAGGNYHPAWESCVTVGSNWMPIGVSSACALPGSPTAGVVFDGGGKTITGLKFGRNVARVGFYAEVINAKIRRLNLKNAAVTGVGNVGIVVGQSYISEIRSITVDFSSVNSTSTNTGLLTGSSLGGSFKDILVTRSTIIGTSSVGGVVGRAILNTGSDTVNLTRVFVEADVGNVLATTNVGGLVGQYGSSSVLSTISNSRFIGNVAGLSSIGGLVGNGASARIEHSYAKATLATRALSGNETGGLAGNYSGRLANGTSGIYSSYYYGLIYEACTVNDIACKIGTIVGTAPGFPATDMAGIVYPLFAQLNFTTSVFGHPQNDADFLTMTPGWVDGGTDLMPYFPASNWIFANGSVPKLLSEP